MALEHLTDKSLNEIWALYSGWIAGIAVLLIFFICWQFFLSRIRAKKFKRAFAQTEDLRNEVNTIQQKMIAHQKLISLGMLAAGIAHEIKNPLNFIQNFSKLSQDLIQDLDQVIKKDEGKFSEDTELSQIIDSLKINLTKIAEHSQRANDIIQNILLQARGEMQSRSPVQVHNVIDEALKLSYHGMKGLNHSFNVKITTHYDPAVDKINAVSVELSRVLINVLNNAFYSVDEKKKEANNSYIPEIIISTKKLGDRIQIIIHDNGKGISKGNLTKIFTPFFTTKPIEQGNGLGLSLSKELIEEYHGKMEVKSQEGEFAEFIIILPIESPLET